MSYLLVLLAIVTIFFFLLQKKKKNTNNNYEPYISERDRSRVTPFTLCSKASISIAFSIINEIHENNQKEKGQFRSYQSLAYSKEDVIRSFYFLHDCTLFCDSEERIYNNQEFRDSLEGLRAYMEMTYLDIKKEDIPPELNKRYPVSKRDESEDLDLKQLEELKLIDWRNKKQWQYYAEAYNQESLLGKYCLQRASIEIDNKIRR